MPLTCIPEATKKEIKEFVTLLQKLDENKQRGLYLMLQGAAVLSGNKDNIFT